MKSSPIMGLKWLTVALVALGMASTQAQTLDSYLGPASGGEWNTAANWSTLAPPLDATTNAYIGNGTNVNYNIPMTATAFGGLTNRGTLNVNASGFNCAAVIMTNINSRFYVNAGGVVNDSGDFEVSSNAQAVMMPGSSVTVNRLIIGGDDAGGTGTDIHSFGDFTNYGGIFTASSTLLNPGNGSINTPCRLVIAGGTNNLGTYSDQRSPGGANSPPTLGTYGLIVSNGLVNMTSISVGNNAHGIMYVVGGIVTNTGGLTVKNNTLTRPARILQTGGLFVTTEPNAVTMGGTADTVYSILGGTNFVGGIVLGQASTMCTNYFTNAATVYVGSEGVTWNGAAVVTMALNGGGLFGASAPWTGPVGMKLTGGTFTFQTADVNGNPNAITLNGALSGSGNLNVTGGGGLTLGAANTYLGNTIISGGSLVLSASGSLASPRIFVGAGTTFDVSQVSGFTLAGSQTLSGSGVVTGAVLAASAATIYPGSNSVTGTLSFTNGLTESGGVINEFNLSSNPLGPNNDFMVVGGGLNVSGMNTIFISGAVSAGSAYPLINYEGNLTGGIANFTVSGATGALSNSVASSTIYFIAQASVRGPTNVVWIGNAVNNNWDTELTTNWLNTGTGHLDYFVAGDNALFGNLGDTNSVVNLPGTVTPSSIVVNTVSNYIFTGVGLVGGVGGITVSNGTLTVLTTNTYSGPTILAGGTLYTPLLANSGSPSGIGAASSDAGNLIFNGGTLNYYGASVGIDHSLTLTNMGGTIDVTNGATLTENGEIVGNGGLTLIDSGTLRLNAADTYTGNTTLSNGVLNLNNSGAAGSGAIVMAGGTLDLTASGQPTYPNNLTVNANSTLISAGGNNNIVSGSWAGSGSVTLAVNITGTGTFSVNGSMTNYLGTIDLGDDAGFFRFNAGGGNSMFGGPNTTFNLGSNNVVFEARNPGTIAVGALFGGTSTAMKGPSSTAGMLIWQIGANPSVPNSLYFGSIQNNNANEVTSLSKVGNGTLTLGGQNSYTGSTTINSGTLALTNDPDNSENGVISGSTNIVIVSGAVLDVSGRTDDTMPLGSSQYLSGNGTIQGILDTTGGGTVSPGGGVNGALGTLTATNDINLGGTAWMKLNRASSPNSDRLVSSTASIINYGGTIVVTNVGAKLQAGDTFTLFSATTLNNTPTVVLPNYYTWDTSQLTVNGSIKVTGVLPPPSLANVNFSQLANGSITINAANGAANGPVTIVTSTNLALPISSWTTVTSTTFDGSGNLSVGIAVDPAAPASFYALVAQ